MTTSIPGNQHRNILQIKDYSSRTRSPSICSSTPPTSSETFSSGTTPDPQSNVEEDKESQNASNAPTLRGRSRAVTGMVGSVEVEPTATVGGNGNSTEHEYQKGGLLSGLGSRINGLGIKLGVKGAQEPESSSRIAVPSLPAQEDPAIVGEPSSFPPDPKELQGLPLPVRLGLIAPPSTAKRLSKQIPKHPLSSRPNPRYSMGYYFCIAPPFQPPTPNPNSISSPLTPNSNFEFFPSSPLPPIKINNATPTTPLFSDTASISTSHSGGSDSNSNFNFNLGSPTTTSRATSASTRNLSMPWSPFHYFKVSKERVKGKMRESKRHAYPSNEVPYFFGYDEEALEADALIHTLMREHITQDHTSTKFPMDYLPSRVLDLGTGQGLWCIDAARDWSSTEFIGLDVVPIQTPLSVFNDPDLERRVSWVVANFLEELPFPDNSFDFVQMRFVGTGIPEEKWSYVLSEVSRVLIQGGTLEIVDTNFTFYGTPSQMDSQTLEDLTGGKFSTTETREAFEGIKKMKIFNEYDPNHAIEIAFERMWRRRSINLSPLTLIPSTLIMQDVDSIGISTPRHIPITTNPSGHHQEPIDGAPPLLNDPLLPDDIFHFLTQYNRNPNDPTWIEFADDLTRAMMILHQVKTLLSCRDLVWEEAEQEKASELKKIETYQTPTVNPIIHQEEISSTKPFIHPWVSKREFDQLLDSWHSQLVSRANLPELLKTLLDWKDGETSSELTVDDRKAGERFRKMSVSTRDSFSSKRSSSKSSSNYHQNYYNHHHAHPTIRLREVMNQIDDSDYELDSTYEELSSPSTSISTKPSSRDNSKVSLLGIKDLGVWTARGN